MGRILVVEDEAAIGRGLVECLVYQGHDADLVEDGDDGLEAATSGRYDLVLLDVMLPGTDGFAICRQLRESDPHLPVCMLTAKGDEADVLEGFACGADDYVCKPFSVAQLMARVRALLRRAAAPGEDDAGETGPFTLAGVEVDPANLRIVSDGTAVPINRRDVAILRLMAAEDRQLLSRRRLLREIWGYRRPEVIETRSVDMHIAKLRKKLRRVGLGEAIETVRGEGYRVRLSA